MESPFDLPGVASGYEDWYSSAFGRLADELERELLAELLGPLGPGTSVLEVGCGTGHFAAALRARMEGVRVVGVDLSPAMLLHARERVPSLRADARRLPFPSATFDAAVLIAVLDFVEDPAQVLREAMRVARGRVVLLALVSHSVLALRRRISGRRGHPIFARARFHSRAELEAFAREAGARITHRRQILVLPPGLAGLLPGLERGLSGLDLRLGGILGLRLEAH